MGRWTYGELNPANPDYQVGVGTGRIMSRFLTVGSPRNFVLAYFFYGIGIMVLWIIGDIACPVISTGFHKIKKWCRPKKLAS